MIFVPTIIKHFNGLALKKGSILFKAVGDIYQIDVVGSDYMFYSPEGTTKSSSGKLPSVSRFPIKKFSFRKTLFGPKLKFDIIVR